MQLKCTKCQRAVQKTHAEIIEMAAQAASASVGDFLKKYVCTTCKRRRIPRISKSPLKPMPDTPQGTELVQVKPKGKKPRVIEEQKPAPDAEVSPEPEKSALEEEDEVLITNLDELFATEASKYTTVALTPEQEKLLENMIRNEEDEEEISNTP